ncbi:MAG: hypothetical protein NC397_05455 [Clostridium sp.]|nr:hypothetical protein [Clostridium sp.]
MQTKEDLMSLGFNEKEAEVLTLLDDVIFSKEDYVNNDLCFDLSQHGICELTVTLKNAVLSTEIPTDDLVSLEGIQIIKTAKGYSFVCNAGYFDFQNDKHIAVPLTIEFDCLKIISKALKANFCIIGSPWESLSLYACNIYEKVREPYLDSNEKENALAPLLKEFYILFNGYLQANDEMKLDTLKSKLPKDKKLNKFFDSIEKSNSIDARSKAINKLFLYMSCETFEDSWRSILDLLNDSQSDYEEKDNSEIYNMLTAEHNDIDEVMHLNGYTGVYPSYKKNTKIKGIHLQRNYENLYFVGMESATVFIECKDEIFEECGNIVFEIYTALGKPNKIKDKYSCLFSKKGKGYYKSEFITYEIDELKELHFDDEAKQIPHIVCKEAELKNLSKAEKKILGTAKTKEEILFTMSLWLMFGLLFGVFMTLGFILIEFLAVLCLGRVSDFSWLFLQTPWWKIFLFSWLGFGGLMGISSLIAD